ncbi:MAG: bifunctional 2-polyprenyl-6-hydroxyphenol methylase/3-demethylubiquinol 3-O-methyltransferase UbiG [bacterium]
MNTNDTQSDDNIDPEEVGKFDALAARWWDAESEFKPLHQINPLRLNFIDARSPLDGKAALDVGCGGGILAEAMALRGAAVTGIDVGEAALEVAKLHALESGASVNYRRITAEALADEQLADERKAQWDIVCCMELLEHVPDPARVVAACATLAKPGGAVYFSTINRNLKSFLFAIVGAEYVLGLLPRGTHQYEKLIRPSELNRWCLRHELNLAEITGLHYNPLAKTYSLGGDVAVNYMVHCVKDSC